VLQQFPLLQNAIDRGQQYPGATYEGYVSAVGAHRKTGWPGLVVRLDQDGPNPVVITVLALNGAGVSTTNENDLSLTATVQFGQFRAEIGGDLSGDSTQMYQDIETHVAPKVGRIDVYKVHHHCSSHSTNDTWLTTTKPTIGIISAGDGNSYGHPTQDCLERLHAGGVKTYWTEAGAGGTPEPGFDLVGGNMVVEVAAGANTYTIRHNGSVVDTYTVALTGGGNQPSMPKYAWSSKSGVYHLTNCDYVSNISPDNLQKGDTPPDGKTLHKGCPLIRNH